MFIKLLIPITILLSILSMSLGILTYSSKKAINTTVRQENLENTQIQMFNSNFEGYKGTNINSSNVKTLLQLIKNSNDTNTQYIQVIFGKIIVDDIDDIMDKVTSGEKYDIQLRYDIDGYIYEIYIQPYSDGTLSINEIDI